MQMIPAAPLRVTQFHRKPYGGYFSIERVFASLQNQYPEDIDCRKVVCRFRSCGIFRRLWNLVEVVFQQGQINHITGDVYYLAALLRRRRTILTIHDCVLLRQKKGIQRWAYKNIWYSMPMRRSAIVVAISESTRRELMTITPSLGDRIVVIPVPLVGGFAPSSKPFRQDEPVILHIGTAPNKNLERVARALEGIRCRMDIVGTLNPSQQQALAENHILYTNSTNLTDAEIVEKYRAADIVEFCSTYEGFGMPIIEAQATGRPVVTSLLEPMSSVANGAACLVDPEDPASIRKGILRVIEDEAYRDELVRRGFENATRFRPEAIAEAYAECYRKLARGIA